MKHIPLGFLKIIILGLALIVLSILAYFPQTEGRAANLDLIGIYSDPLILYVYLASTPFFVGLFHAFKVLNLVGENRAFSQQTVNSLKSMKYAALSLIVSILGALVFIRFQSHGDDASGPIVIGVLLLLAFTVLYVIFSEAQKLLQNAVDMKKENDLTI